MSDFDLKIHLLYLQPDLFANLFTADGIKIIYSGCSVARYRASMGC
ncbi:MAG: hypothetical protein JWR38_3003 [Mucilaginibacter sp.]|nr:hypothetical protein [Mucilaginibacter sp.]